MGESRTPATAVGATVEAAPRTGVGLASCEFYHSIDLPSHGRQHGGWNLIGRFDDYIGHQDIAGRTLLDVGTATGFLTFEAEKRGAIVTSLDAPSAADWEWLPIRGSKYVDDRTGWLAEIGGRLERIKNGYWLSHRDLRSNARCVYRNIYEIDETVGVFDIVLIGQVLIHLRDAIGALEAATRVCRDRIIIVEGAVDDEYPVAALAGRVDRPDVAYAWYQYSRGWYREVLTMLGFREITFTTGTYECLRANHEREIELTTVVGTRGAAT